jgi:Fic family protein
MADDGAHVPSVPIDASRETFDALAGFRIAMTYVLQLAHDDDVVFGEQLLKSPHFMMVGHDLRTRPGRWRSGSILVNDESTGSIVYEGPAVELVPALVAELVVRINRSIAAPTLLDAAMAHLNLVMIHPFRDGNGRMGRTLQTLVLARRGTPAPEFSSIEEYLGRNTRAYYDVLAVVGGGRWQPGRDARPWVRFVLTAHLRQARTMQRRVRESERLWVDLDRVIASRGLPPRVFSALFDAAIGSRVRNVTYRAALRSAGEDITEVTASRDLKALHGAGLLDAIGERRGRFYRAAAELQAIRAAVVAGRDPRDDADPFAGAPDHDPGTLF